MIKLLIWIAQIKKQRIYSDITYLEVWWLIVVSKHGCHYMIYRYCHGWVTSLWPMWWSLGTINRLQICVVSCFSCHGCMPYGMNKVCKFTVLFCCCILNEPLINQLKHHKHWTNHSTIKDSTSQLERDSYFMTYICRTNAKNTRHQNNSYFQGNWYDPESV